MLCDWTHRIRARRNQHSGGALAGGFLRAHDPGANRRLNDAHRLPHAQRFNHGPTAGAFLPGLVHD